MNIKNVFGSVSDIHDLRCALDNYLKTLQCENDSLMFCYVQLLSSSLENPLIYLHNRFPEAWQAIYDLKKYHTIDPSWRHAKQLLTPFFWSDLSDLSDEEKNMVQDAQDHHLKSGVLVPFQGKQGYSLLWVMSSVEESQCREKLERAKNLAYNGLPYIFEAVSHVVFGKERILTKRESETLYWIAEGLKTQDVAQKLFVTTVTVEKHVSSACHKLGAKNRTHCIRIANDLGLLIAGETQLDYDIL